MHMLLKACPKELFGGAKGATDGTATSDGTSLDDVFQGAKDFVNKGESDSSNVFNQSKIKQASDVVYNILLAVGMVVAIVVGIILGIQFMMGGAEEQAQVKESLIPYGIGCVVVFGAFAIWKILVEILQNI